MLTLPWNIREKERQALGSGWLEALVQEKGRAQERCSASSQDHYSPSGCCEIQCTRQWRDCVVTAIPPKAGQNLELARGQSRKGGKEMDGIPQGTNSQRRKCLLPCSVLQAYHSNHISSALVGWLSYQLDLLMSQQDEEWSRDFGNVLAVRVLSFGLPQHRASP